MSCSRCFATEKRCVAALSRPPTAFWDGGVAAAVTTRRRHQVPSAGWASLKGDEANGGAVTLTQRVESADDLSGDLHCLVRDGINRYGPAGVPPFVGASSRPASRSVPASELQHSLAGGAGELLGSATSAWFRWWGRWEWCRRCEDHQPLRRSVWAARLSQTTLNHAGPSPLTK